MSTATSTATATISSEAIQKELQKYNFSSFDEEKQYWCNVQGIDRNMVKQFKRKYRDNTRYTIPADFFFGCNVHNQKEISVMCYVETPNVVQFDSGKFVEWRYNPLVPKKMK